MVLTQSSLVFAVLTAGLKRSRWTCELSGMKAVVETADRDVDTLPKGRRLAFQEIKGAQKGVGKAIALRAGSLP